MLALIPFTYCRVNLKPVLHNYSIDMIEIKDKEMGKRLEVEKLLSFLQKPCKISTVLKPLDFIPTGWTLQDN